MSCETAVRGLPSAQTVSLPKAPRAIPAVRFGHPRRHASTWFDLDVASPFMLLALPARPDHAGKIAGVVHVDGIARVQTVDPAAAPAYGALIEYFHQLTGVPVVLNTAFNDREPIVETPAHALATLQARDLDSACVGEYLVEWS
ncbi:carbamoyltransferase C-terminal domain-containing protein [Streptomyces avermitilis]|uniref:carbamoyltransferase C-terminal domain-containing protein n=1 Tax=Streptomyces avermitilis TaxID=33903 RepID=UPI0036962475